MTRRLLAIALVLTLSEAALAQSVADLFRQGNARMALKDAAGALKLYEQALKIAPDTPGVLYNAGLASYMTAKYPRAVEYFTSYRRVASGDYRGLTKLIQALWANGDRPQAQERITELVAWWRSGSNPELSAERSFVRDQFDVRSYHVYAFQFFDPDVEKRERTYEFVVVNGNGQQIARYTMMYDEKASQAARARGRKDARLYFFDVAAAWMNATISTMSFEPSYEQCVEMVGRNLRGEKIPPFQEK